VIVKISPGRGTSPVGLMAYLFGPGRGNEHENQRVIAADGALAVLDGQRLDTVQDRAEVVALGQRLDFAKRVHGVDVPGGHVWHCSLSLPEGESLTDEQWADVAKGAMDAMGFTEASGKAGCRWIAVHHGTSANGNDHIHLAVSLVRADGTKASIWNDRRTMSRYAAQVERELGLFVVQGRAGAGKPGLSRAELERAAETSTEPERVRLGRIVRAHAAASVDEAEFARRLRGDGQLLARARFAAGGQTAVVGYSVALRPDVDAKALWFGGGRLAVDLTLPKLRMHWRAGEAAEVAAAWTGRGTAGREARKLSAAAWPEATTEVEAIWVRLATLGRDDTAGWAWAAREVSGVFAVLSVRLESDPGPLAEVSDALAVMSWRHHGQAPARQPREVSKLRGVAMACRQASRAGGNDATVALIIALFLCVKAIQRANALSRQAANAEQRLAAVVDRTAAALPPGTLDVEPAASRRASRAAAARATSPGRTAGGRSGPDVPPYRPPLPPPGQRPPDRGFGR